MDGPAHYKEAERLLDKHSTGPELLLRAEVHATLAHAAALIYASSPDRIRTAWHEATA